LFTNSDISLETLVRADLAKLEREEEELLQKYLGVPGLKVKNLSLGQVMHLITHYSVTEARLTPSQAKAVFEKGYNWREDESTDYLSTITHKAVYMDLLARLDEIGSMIKSSRSIG